MKEVEGVEMHGGGRLSYEGLGKGSFGPTHRKRKPQEEVKIKRKSSL